MLSLWPRGAMQTRSALSRPCLLDLLESRAWVQLAQESRRGRDLRVAQACVPGEASFGGTEPPFPGLWKELLGRMMPRAGPLWPAVCCAGSGLSQGLVLFSQSQRLEVQPSLRHRSCQT